MRLRLPHEIVAEAIQVGRWLAPVSVPSVLRTRCFQLASRRDEHGVVQASGYGPCVLGRPNRAGSAVCSHRGGRQPVGGSPSHRAGHAVASGRSDAKRRPALVKNRPPISARSPALRRV